MSADRLPKSGHRVSPVDPEGRPDYSVVIPVFNSAAFVERTIDRCVAFFEATGRSFELVLVDDGSADASWEVLRRRAAGDTRLVALELLHNYGQHTAVWCGLAHSRGRRVITLDDDLQNPPEQIELLIAAADEGADTVFGRPRENRRGIARRLGSLLVDRLDSKVFRSPRGLVLTNFRLLDRGVVDRMLAQSSGLPYVNGLAAVYSRRPVNVTVEHRPREHGRSGYGPGQIVRLLGRILFGYSAFPLRLVSAIGLLASVASFALGTYVLWRALFHQTQVPGWASVVVILSFFNAITLLSLSILGEYIVRTLRQVEHLDRYHVIDAINADDRRGD
jgi:glycosyltransferase involved in cell wall biosynthesis